MYDRKIISGTGKNNFEPDNAATREEFVKMLLLSKGIAPGEYETGFLDVSSSEWYYTYVGAAKKAGIVKGIEENRFGTGLNITREDMCVLIYRAFYDGQTAEEYGFYDSRKISDYAKNAVNVLCKNGILKGDENSNFNPQDNATRAEIAAVLYRIIGE